MESTPLMYSVVYSKFYYHYFFNGDNVLLCVIYLLNVTVFMHVIQISLYMTLRIVFGIIRGFL